MRRFRTSLFWLCAALAFAACSEGGTARNVLMEVNGQRISLADFRLKLLDYTSGQTPSKLPPRREAFEPMKKEILNNLIEYALLAEEASKHNISVSTEELRSEIAKVEVDYPQDSLKKVLAQSGIAYKDWQKKVERSLLARKTVEAISARTPPPGEEELRQVYQKRAGEFAEQPLLRLSQLLVKDAAQAENLRRLLSREPKRFAELAREQSLGPEAAAGGEMGLVGKNRLPEKIWNPLNRVPAGSISPVIKSELGFHLFLVEEKTRSQSKTFEEVREHLAAEINSSRRQETYHAWLKDSLRQAKILRNQKLLAILWDRLVVPGHN